jgi:hypothetical protein
MRESEGHQSVVRVALAALAGPGLSVDLVTIGNLRVRKEVRQMGKTKDVRAAVQAELGSDYRDDVQLIIAANNALAQNVTVPGGGGGRRQYYLDR